jgi:hypothetical protein
MPTKILLMLNRDPDGKTQIWDPGWKKFGSEINIPDPQHWSQRLLLFPEQGL